MTWNWWYRLTLDARTSLVLWTGCSLVAALAVTPAVRWLDGQTGWGLFGFSPDGARTILGALAASMLTFIVFVLSATLIVVQLASGQLTPRVIALVFAQRWVRATLGVFTFTYGFTLAALARTESLLVDSAVVLNLACIVVFFHFVQRLSSGLRPSTMLRVVAGRGREVIAQVYPQPHDPARPEGTAGVPLPASPPRVVPFEGTSGVVMAFSATRLARLARASDAVFELVPQVGDSVTPGQPLLRVYGGTGRVTDAALRGCVAVGGERTLEQDPRFAFRILVDIASKALSPAINDPTTAVLALDQIASLLLDVGRRRLDEGVVRDADGAVRLVYGTPDWPDYVVLAVSEVRHYGAGSMQVYRRLRAMLEHLIADLPADRRPPLAEELALLGRAVERGFQDESDRRLAGIADLQGVGGSES
jgi:uncharacterized membrane protein